MTDEARKILERMRDDGSLSQDDQRQFAAEFGVKVRDLPLQFRGGLMGVFFGEQHDDR